MSSSESTSSFSSEISSNNSEEVFEDFGGEYLPYQNEPVASENEDDDEDRPRAEDQPEDEDGILPVVFRERFEGNLPVRQWCECGNCSEEHLETAREFRCCHEVAPAFEKLENDGLSDTIHCITEHEDYRAFTNRNILLNVGPMFRTRNGRPYTQRANVTENEYLRAVAYRWLARWFFGYLGWDNTRPLPACVYRDIRERYATGQRTGYRETEERA